MENKNKILAAAMSLAIAANAQGNTQILENIQQDCVKELKGSENQKKAGNMDYLYSVQDKFMDCVERGAKQKMPDARFTIEGNLVQEDAGLIRESNLKFDVLSTTGGDKSFQYTKQGNLSEGEFYADMPIKGSYGIKLSKVLKKPVAQLKEVERPKAVEEQKRDTLDAKTLSIINEYTDPAKIAKRSKAEQAALEKREKAERAAEARAEKERRAQKEKQWAAEQKRTADSLKAEQELQKRAEQDAKKLEEAAIRDAKREQARLEKQTADSIRAVKNAELAVKRAEEAAAKKQTADSLRAVDNAKREAARAQKHLDDSIRAEKMAEERTRLAEARAASKRVDSLRTIEINAERAEQKRIADSIKTEQKVAAAARQDSITAARAEQAAAKSAQKHTDDSLKQIAAAQKLAEIQERRDSIALARQQIAEQRRAADEERKIQAETLRAERERIAAEKRAEAEQKRAAEIAQKHTNDSIAREEKLARRADALRRDSIAQAAVLHPFDPLPEAQGHTQTAPEPRAQKLTMNTVVVHADQTKVCAEDACTKLGGTPLENGKTMNVYQKDGKLYAFYADGTRAWHSSRQGVAIDEWKGSPETKKWLESLLEK
jgi:hypothetical protein